MDEHFMLNNLALFGGMRCTLSMMRTEAITFHFLENSKCNEG